MSTFVRPTNGAESTLASPRAGGGSTLALAAGTGARFGSNYPIRVGVRRASDGAVVYLQAAGRAGDTLTGVAVVAAGPDASADLALAAGDEVRGLVSAGLYQDHSDAINAIEAQLPGLGTPGGALLAANNLSDLANAGTARTNLGLGTAATSAAPAFATAAQGAKADTAVQPAGLAPYAPLFNPTLTGVPAAPTAAGGTNTTQIATCAFVRAEFATLVGAAPNALDTVYELAAALGNDQNFAATMATALAGKAPSVHTHAQADVTGLVSALAGKAASSHQHAAADVTSGVFDPARLASGTPAAGKYPDGSGVWTNLPSGGGSGTTLVLFVQTTDSSPVGDNSTAFTSVLGTGTGSLVLPAGFWTVGKTIRLTFAGFHTTASGASGRIDMRLYFGATPLLAVGNNITAGGGPKQIGVVATITCLSTGSSGQFAIQMYGYTWITVAVGTAKVTADTTGAMTLDLRAAFSVATSGNSVYSVMNVLESLN